MQAENAAKKLKRKKWNHENENAACHPFNLWIFLLKMKKAQQMHEMYLEMLWKCFENVLKIVSFF